MDITELGIAALPAITVICLLVAQAAKATALDNKWLPVICGAVGGVLGALAMRIMPDYPPWPWASSPVSRQPASIKSISSSPEVRRAKRWSGPQ